jgi:hypothetical protein
VGRAVRRIAAVGALALLPVGGPAAEPGGHTGTKQSTSLYTPPDPTAAGGIRGALGLASPPIRRAFALPTDNPRFVYEGAVAADSRRFSFAGLPTAKYDLLLLGDDGFYEGLTLCRGDNTLTDRDRQAIRDKIMASVPFFNEKEIHRCEGTTGREGKARCMLQEVRTRPVTLQDGSVRPDIQIRSLKLALLEDVGPAGWDLVTTREIVRMEVAGQERKGMLPARHVPKLGGIRVVDAVKELGTLAP